MGMTSKQLKLCLLKPDAFQHIDVDSTLNKLENIVHYMYRSAIGGEPTYWFQAKPNININSDRERLDTYLRQVNVYAYLAEKVLGLKVNRMTLYYTGESGNSPEMAYTFDEEQAEKFVKGFDDTAEKIIIKDFEHRTENLDTCRECVFKHYCGRA